MTVGAPGDLEDAFSGVNPKYDQEAEKRFNDTDAFSPGISKSNIKRENYGMSDPGATSNH